MTASTSVLIIAPRSDQAALSAPFAVAGFDIELASAAREALEAVRARRRGGRFFTAIVLDSGLADPDPLGLIGDLRRVDPRSTRCLAARDDAKGRKLSAAGPQHGVKHVLPHPPSASHVYLLAGERSDARSDDQTPFFGTRRLPAPTTSYFRAPLGEAIGGGTPPPQQPPSTPNPALAAARPEPADPFEQHLPPGEREPASHRHPATRGFSSRRVRRGIGGRLSPDQEQRTIQEQTHRIGSDARQVRCAHCGKGFAVVQRSRSYAAPCVHCGTFNTIAGSDG